MGQTATARQAIGTIVLSVALLASVFAGAVWMAALQLRVLIEPWARFLIRI